MIVEELRALAPSCKVLALSVVDEPASSPTCCGPVPPAHALKTEAPERADGCGRTVARGAQYLRAGSRATRSKASSATAHQTPDACLDAPRARGVRAARSRATSNKRDRDEAVLFARRTVETHRYRITRKLDAHSVLDLQRVATRDPRLGQVRSDPDPPAAHPSARPGDAHLRGTVHPGCFVDTAPRSCTPRCDASAGRRTQA